VKNGVVVPVALKFVRVPLPLPLNRGDQVFVAVQVLYACAVISQMNG